LFAGGFAVFDDLLGQNVGIGKVVGFFEALVAEPEDVEAGFCRGCKLITVFFLPRASLDL
jgi:hypothetical protein